MRPAKRTAVVAGVWLAVFLVLVAILFGALTVGSIAAGWGPDAAQDRLLTSGQFAFLCLLIGWFTNACEAFYKKRGIGRYRR